MKANLIAINKYDAMIKSQIGTNAGKIWQFLDKNEISSVLEIEKNLPMEQQDLLMALGWLARENKIYLYGDKNDRKIMIIY